MPMYQDPDRQRQAVAKPTSPLIPPPLSHRPSEDSIRTEFCEGPLLDVPNRSATPKSDDRLHLEDGESPQSVPNDRQQLIQRLKREQVMQIRQVKQPNIEVASTRSTINNDYASGRLEPPLQFPSIQIKDTVLPSRNDTAIRPSSRDSWMSSGLEIERPRSALHTGDFTQSTATAAAANQPLPNTPSIPAASPLATSPPVPWIQTNQHRRPSIRTSHSVSSPAIPIDSQYRSQRSRAPSLQSYSSSFVLKAPTSPLVQQANNEDLDFSPIDSDIGSNKSNRRHTLPPHSLQFTQPVHSSLVQAARHPPSFQRDAAFPSRSYHSRKSIGSVGSFQASVSPPTPDFLRSRKPSFSGEGSPLQHAMVGSYEESILRGRMSATPSKPLDFTAQIGALGRGDCKPKYPAHVTLSFPAVYYSWSTGSNGRLSNDDDEPSPYVGQIDLEQGLPPPQKKEKRSRRRCAPTVASLDNPDDSLSNEGASRKRKKPRRRSPSPPKTPIGGSYRIPQQGQLQILIKNPNKTATKLFLVPYDLSDMESGTKTFIRQKCYSAGPVIENPLTSRPASISAPELPLSNTGNPQPSSLSPTNSKPRLRYLIHLQICCPARGRFYLYKNISVVFANRVPDNKEQLQNEIRLPEPRYSPYKPHIDSAVSSPLNLETKRATDKQIRRRSYGYGTSAGGHGYRTSFSASDGMQGSKFSPRGLSYPKPQNTSIPPVPAIPYSFTTPEKCVPSLGTLPEPERMDLDDQPERPPVTDRQSTSDNSPIGPVSGVQSPLSEASIRLGGELNGSMRSSSSKDSNDSWGKLSRGEAGYGGVFGRPGTPEPGEGLLARKLKRLDVEMRKEKEKEQEKENQKVIRG